MARDVPQLPAPTMAMVFTGDRRCVRRASRSAVRRPEAGVEYSAGAAKWPETSRNCPRRRWRWFSQAIAAAFVARAEARFGALKQALNIRPVPPDDQRRPATARADDGDGFHRRSPLRSSREPKRGSAP